MAAILNGRTVHVTDAVALFPRFPHLVEAGRIELPLAVHPLRSPTALTCRPRYLLMVFIHLACSSSSDPHHSRCQKAKSSKDVNP